MIRELAEKPPRDGVSRARPVQGQSPNDAAMRCCDSGLVDQGGGRIRPACKVSKPPKPSEPMTVPCLSLMRPEA